MLPTIPRLEDGELLIQCDTMWCYYA